MTTDELYDALLSGLDGAAIEGLIDGDDVEEIAELLTAALTDLLVPAATDEIDEIAETAAYVMPWDRERFTGTIGGAHVIG